MLQTAIAKEILLKSGQINGRTSHRLPLFWVTSVLMLSLLLGNWHMASAQEPTRESNNQTSQLDIIQTVLDTKLNARKTLRDSIKKASPDELAELETALADLNSDIKKLRGSFEQIAVGTADMSVFSEEPSEVDWRSEVTQIVMPIMENLKSLTEKPRKIEMLKSQIRTANEQIEEIDVAVLSIQERALVATTEETKLSLDSLMVSWSERRVETLRSIELATSQLENIQKSDTSFFESFKAGLIGFIKGRGLTIVLAIAAASAVWFLVRLISKLLERKSKGEEAKSFKTRQRLTHYAFKVVTALLMLVAVIVVFYERGDVLLLGVAFLFAAAIILGLRNTIPKFIAESRLLLNLGAIREDERVLYNGLPYRVTALNVYSVLRNPELIGVIRLPLEHMLAMVSRPSGKESWFPSSRGDYVVLSDGRLLKVIEQTTEVVVLENLSGTRTTVPSADFYTMSFDNLSRGEFFSVVSIFGVGYKHQAISSTKIPACIKKSVTAALAKTDLSGSVEKVAVELKEAGASSLDFWICVTMKSTAASSYNKLLRIIQQTCVETCTAEEWDIPFPQLTLHRE